MKRLFTIPSFPSILLALTAASLLAVNAQAKKAESEAKAAYADTVAVGGSTPESVAIKGTFAVHVKVSIPATPCTTAIPCANVPVSLEVELGDGIGKGAVTGKSYEAAGAGKSSGLFTMPGGVALIVPIKVKGEGSSGLASAKVFAIVDGTGAVAQVSVPPSGMVSWWRGDGDAKDSQGTNPGTAVGPLGFTGGKNGQAFAFVPGAYVDAGGNDTLKLPKLTASAWVKSPSHPGTSHYVLAQGANACETASYALASNTAAGTTFGPADLTFQINTGSPFPYASPDAAGIWDGNWHFVAGTYDGANIRLFVDGVEKGTGTAATLPINYSLPEQKFYIGAYHSSVCNLDSTGPSDDVRIFNRALSLAEINALSKSATIKVDISN